MKKTNLPQSGQKGSQGQGHKEVNSEGICNCYIKGITLTHTRFEPCTLQMNSS